MFMAHIAYWVYKKVTDITHPPFVPGPFYHWFNWKVNKHEGGTRYFLIQFSLQGGLNVKKYQNAFRWPSATSYTASCVGPPLLCVCVCIRTKYFDRNDLTNYWVSPNMESHIPLPCISQPLEQLLREPRLLLLSATAATALHLPPFPPLGTVAMGSMCWELLLWPWVRP